MSCIWLEQRQGVWQSRTLTTGRLLPGEEIGAPGIALVSLASSSALLAREFVRIRINGESVVAGVRMLDHRDEILIGRKLFYFSTQTAPQVVVYSATEGQRLPICGICRGPLRDGMTGVCCPGCNRWYHQQDASGELSAKPCWTYAPQCRFCKHPTAFDTEGMWQPGDDRD